MIDKINRLVYFFLKIADRYYDDFREKVEDASKSNPYPFSNWFDSNGRAYIDFKSNINNDNSINEISETDTKVINFLEDLGYRNIDYYNGYAEKDGRKLRIGKILNNLKSRENKDIVSEDFNEKYDINDLELYINIFNNSLFRSFKSVLKNANLKIVFSQDPHDVAMMSTNRGWTSCKDLGKEDNYSEGVFCEVESGGFVAYLIDGDDLEIKHPYARVLIKRFVSNDGKSIAIPEERVYGSNIEGFLSEVNKWVDAHQEVVESGLYELKGDSYSDSFSDFYYHNNKKNENLEGASKDELLHLLNDESNFLLNGKFYKTLEEAEDANETLYNNEGSIINTNKKNEVNIIYMLIGSYLGELNDEEIDELFFKFIDYELYSDSKLLIKFLPYIKLKHIILIPREYIDNVLGSMPDVLKSDYENYILKTIRNILKNRLKSYYNDVIFDYMNVLSNIPDDVLDSILNLDENYVDMFISYIDKFTNKLSLNSLRKIKDRYLNKLQYKDLNYLFDKGVFTSNDSEKLKVILDKAITEYKSIDNSKKDYDTIFKLNDLKSNIIKLKKNLSDIQGGKI